MSDYSIKDMKIQGKTAMAIYNYKATMNDELNLKIDDMIVLTQCSEDETWLEGTLNGITGWFPSNYVQIVDHSNPTPSQTNEEISTTLKKSSSNTSNKYLSSQENHMFRVKHLNELKLVEEAYLDEMCKFLKTTWQPLLQSSSHQQAEILPQLLNQQILSSLEDLIRCHQFFHQQIKEIPENSDAKIGHLLITLAPQFKQSYDSYAKLVPKVAFILFKKSAELNQLFESSNMNDNNVSVYLCKHLNAPFKQLDLYCKLLKELQRYTEDYHVDRGDLQRSIEFYLDLQRECVETRKRKELELDIIMKANFSDTEKCDSFQFLSPILLINNLGERMDCILCLTPTNSLLALTQPRPDEFAVEFKLQLNKTNQFKKINIANMEYINSHYGQNNQSNLTKYLFELSSIQCFNSRAKKQVDRILVVCSSVYDFKTWSDLLTNFFVRSQSSNHKSATNYIKQTSFRNIIQSSDFASSNSIQQQQQKQQQPHQQPSSPAIACNNVKKSNNTFSMRPHAPLLPHFQLPGEQLQINPNDLSLSKRFMYKKPKLSDPFGKYHGADDDLKLLNMIESLFQINKTKSIQKHSDNSKREEMQQSPSKTTKEEAIKEQETKSNSEKSVRIYLKKLADDKIRLESTIQTLSSELNQTNHLNKELKIICSNLSKQLETERHARKKMESFIKRHLNNSKSFSTHHDHSNSALSHSSNPIEHESSI